MATNEHSTPLNEVTPDLTSVLSGVTTVIPSLISGVASNVSDILTDTDVTLPSLISGANVNILSVNSAVSTVNNYVSGLPGLDNPYKSRGVFSISLNSFVTVFQTTNPCFAFIQAWADDSAASVSEVCVYAGLPLDGNLVAYAKLAAGTSQVVCCFPSYFDPFITVQTKSDGVVPVRVGITVNTDGGETVTDYATGVDCYLVKNVPDTNFGSGTTVEIQNCNASLLEWALLKPDLSAVSSDTPIQSAVLSLLNQDTDSYNNVTIHALMKNWVETEATWNIYSTGNSWDTAGCGSGTDYRASVEFQADCVFTAGSRTEFDITSLVREWVSGTLTNYGLIINTTAAYQYKGTHSFQSYNNATPSSRPYVRITTF